MAHKEKKFSIRSVQTSGSFKTIAFSVGFMCLADSSPLADTISEYLKRTEQTRTEQPTTLRVPVEYKGEIYPAWELKAIGKGYVDESSIKNGDYKKAFEIAKILNESGCEDEAFPILSLLYDLIRRYEERFQGDEEIVKEICILHAKLCEKRGRYDEAGWAYRRAGEDDKADECFERETLKIDEEIKGFEEKTREVR